MSWIPVAISTVCMMGGVSLLAFLVRSVRHRSIPRLEPVGVDSSNAVHHRLAGVVGRELNRLLRRGTQPYDDVRLGRQAIGVVTACALSPLAGFVVATALFGSSVRRRRRAAQERVSAIHEALAEVIDLYAVALHSGHNVTTATVEVGRWIEGDVGDAFRACSARVVQGQRQSDSLEEVAAVLGSDVRPLIAALVANDRHGAPISHSLTQLAADTRADRRRLAEARARRLPVTLLFPLVVCVLPAFLLLTVVPVIAETFGSLNLGS